MRRLRGEEGARGMIAGPRDGARISGVTHKGGR
jgi:hypothetical protein